jgi:integrase
MVSVDGETQTFRLKSEAQAFFDQVKKSRKKDIQQLETTFEAQIKLRDKDGNVIKETRSFPTRAEAEQWSSGESTRLLAYKKEYGQFDHTFETMTFEHALLQTVEEHYKKKASYKENKYRVPYILERLPKNLLFKDVTQQMLAKLKARFEHDGYSDSSVRNFFVVISSTFKHAQLVWLYPVDYNTKRVKLEKIDNAIERNWEDKTERGRLIDSLKKNRPWLLPIVEMSLEMSFRLGELVKPTIDFPDAEYGGLKWEGVDFEEGTVRLFKEKNDWKKTNSETKGRTVPMTKRMYEILLEAHGPLPKTKRGPVFLASKNSVSTAFVDVCKLAEPPIKNLTFHSLRKIATYSLSKNIDNPIMLGRLTGHRDIKTLSDRYYKVPIEDLKILVNQYDEKDIIKKGIIALQKQLGYEGAKTFLLKIRELTDEDSAKTAE